MSIDYYKQLHLDELFIDQLNRELKKLNKNYYAAVIDGNPSTDKEEALRKLWEDSNCVGLLCTTKAGGESRDYSIANVGLFLDEDYSPVTDIQGKGRLDRKGQKAKKVFIYYLHLTNSIDQIIRNRIKRKSELIDMALGEIPLLPQEKKELYAPDLIKIKEGLREQRKRKTAYYTYYHEFRRHTSHIIGAKTKEASDRYKKRHGKEIAISYNKDFWYRYQSNVNRLEAKILEELKEKGLINQNPNIADLGSASGSTSVIINYPTYNVDEIWEMLTVGRDIVRQELKEENKNFENSTNILGKLNNIPLGSENFDIAFLNLVLQWNNDLEDRIRIINEANRILKKEGYLFMTFHYKEIDQKGQEKVYSGLKSLGFEVIKEISGFAKATEPQDSNFKTFIAVAKKKYQPSSNINTKDFDFLVPKTKRKKIMSTTDIVPQPRYEVCEKFSFFDRIRNKEVERGDVYSLTTKYTEREDERKIQISYKRDRVKYSILSRIEQSALAIHPDRRIRVKRDLLSIVRNAKDGGVPINRIRDVIRKIEEGRTRVDDSSLRKELRKINDYLVYITNF